MFILWYLEGVDLGFRFILQVSDLVIIYFRIVKVFYFYIFLVQFSLNKYLLDSYFVLEIVLCFGNIKII